MQNVWSKAPKDAEFAGTLRANQMQVFYKNVTDLDCEYSYGGSWSKNRGAPSCLPLIPRPSGWTGEGLPPVGTDCEASVFNSLGKPEWVKAKVVHRVRNSVAVAHGPDLGLVVWAQGWRPTRTPEQSAKEEREAQIDKMFSAASGWPNSLAVRSICAYMYDAGARMPEAK